MPEAEGNGKIHKQLTTSIIAYQLELLGTGFWTHSGRYSSVIYLDIASDAEGSSILAHHVDWKKSLSQLSDFELVPRHSPLKVSRQRSPQSKIHPFHGHFHNNVNATTIYIIVCGILIRPIRYLTFLCLSRAGLSEPCVHWPALIKISPLLTNSNRLQITNLLTPDRPGRGSPRPGERFPRPHTRDLSHATKPRRLANSRELIGPPNSPSIFSPPQMLSRIGIRRM